MNGTAAVWLFWVMSGFVLSLQFFLRTHQTPLTRAHDYLEDAFLRRYPRLLVPVLASVIIAYFLLAHGFMKNAVLAHSLSGPYRSEWLAGCYPMQANFINALKSACWNTFFCFDRAPTYNNVLWTMETEFYGSLFLFALLGLLGHRNCRFLVYILTVGVSRALKLDWLDTFVFGIALCDLFVNGPRVVISNSISKTKTFHWLRHSKIVAIPFWILLIITLGLPNNHDYLYAFSGVAAVAFTLVSLPTQHVLSKWLPQFLGRTSFSLYLIHVPIICSFSCWFFMKFEGDMGRVQLILLTSVITCFVSCAAGHFFYLAADRPGIRFSRWFSLSIINSRFLPARYLKPQPQTTLSHNTVKPAKN